MGKCPADMSDLSHVPALRALKSPHDGFLETSFILSCGIPGQWRDKGPRLQATTAQELIPQLKMKKEVSAEGKEPFMVALGLHQKLSGGP